LGFNPVKLGAWHTFCSLSLSLSLSLYSSPISKITKKIYPLVDIFIRPVPRSSGGIFLPSRDWRNKMRSSVFPALICLILAQTFYDIMNKNVMMILIIVDKNSIALHNFSMIYTIQNEAAIGESLAFGVPVHSGDIAVAGPCRPAGAHGERETLQKGGAES
jgi:hypothetical protein